MTNTITRTAWLIAMLGWGIMASAQTVRYEVSTLIPSQSHLLDDCLSIDEQGNVYGSYYGDWQGAAGTHVLRYRPTGQFDTLATGLSRPNGNSYHNGKVYVANSVVGEIWVIDTSGQVDRVIALQGVSNVVPVPGTDSLVAVSWGASTVYGISANGTVSTVSNSPLFNGLAGAVYDPQGRLYVANYNNGRIMRQEADGTFVLFQDIGGGIGFIAYADGAILATNHTDNKVYRVPVDSSGAFVIAGSGQAQVIDGVGDSAAFHFPNGIVATPSGDTIYVSEFASKSLRMIVRSTVADTTTSDTTNTDTTTTDTTTTGLHFRGEATPSIYPIPSSGQLSFQNLDMRQVGRIRLVDVQGRRVYESASPSFVGQDSIQLPPLPAGSYWLRVWDRQEGLLMASRVMLQD